MRNSSKINGEFKNWLTTKRQKLELRAIQELSGGLVCICSDCKKVRDEQGYWSESRVNIYDNPNIEFTHGFCPDCLSQRHLEIDEYLGLT